MRPAADLASVSAGFSLTISEFCKRHGLSRGKYFSMRRAGLGPIEMRLGPGMVRITAEADRAWQHARQNPTGDELAEIERGRAVLAERGSRAGRAAVQSAKHASNKRQRRGMS